MLSSCMEMYLDIPFRGNSEMMYLILSACAMMFSGNGKCWMIVSRWDRKCVKIGKLDVCQLLNCCVSVVGIVK